MDLENVSAELKRKTYLDFDLLVRRTFGLLQVGIRQYRNKPPCYQRPFYKTACICHS